MKSVKVRFLIASLLALLLYGAEAYARDAAPANAVHYSNQVSVAI